MRLSDFATYRPDCPTCRAAGRAPRPLVLVPGATRDEVGGEDIREGILRCPEERCQREHPIVDGIPIIVPDLRSWAGYQLDAVLRRKDLGADLRTLFGDAAGPDSQHERDRSTLSTYAAGHWSDLQDGNVIDRARTAANVADAAIELLGDLEDGQYIDLGCGPGRATFELAIPVDSGVIGLDLNLDFLRLADEIRTTGGASYAQRRLGLVYEQRSVWAGFFHDVNTAFCCADVSALPFADGFFAGGLSLNLLDSVASPLGHLQEAARVVRPGGALVLATPYEWTASATPIEQWIGGHSQRGPSGGASDETMRTLFAPGAAFGQQIGWELEEERDGVSWCLSTHERTTVEYSLHLMRLRRL